jgi:hypothetical protein
MRAVPREAAVEKSLPENPDRVFYSFPGSAWERPLGGSASFSPTTYKLFYSFPGSAWERPLGGSASFSPTTYKLLGF